MEGTRNLKLVLEYDGTDYHGWQVQPGVPTVQQVLEKALERITGGSVRVTGAGRTDAGAHARGQVANFRTSSPIAVERLRAALNAVLPRDISVLEVEEVDGAFHARYSARSKRYRYTILRRMVRSPVNERFAVHIRRPLDLAFMREAARYLVGTYDFSSFCCESGREVNPVRTVLEIAVESRGDFVIIEVEAVSFLYKMARSIVGTLVDVGQGKLKPRDVISILEMRRRGAAGATAPAKGLALLEVKYEDKQEG